MQVDLFLLDLQIPGEDGYEVLQRIREMPGLRNATVVAVTANVMPQDVAKARAAGFDSFIGKPLNRRHFPDQIRRILNGEAVWDPR
jgi:two-component system, cell cycle response regulator DivK